jgi:hypothetical protein
VTDVTALRSRRKHHGAWPHKEHAMTRAIIVAALGLALAASVFVEVSTFAEIASMASFADATIDVPAF